MYMQKIMVCYKIPSGLKGRIDDAAERLGYSRNTIIEDAVTRRLDDIDGKGWKHPTCGAANGHPKCKHFKEPLCSVFNLDVDESFYCAMWEA